MLLLPWHQPGLNRRIAGRFRAFNRPSKPLACLPVSQPLQSPAGVVSEFGSQSTLTRSRLLEGSVLLTGNVLFSRKLEQRPVIGTRQGGVEQGEQFFLGPLAALDFSEDCRADQDLAPRVL